MPPHNLSPRTPGVFRESRRLLRGCGGSRRNLLRGCGGSRRLLRGCGGSRGNQAAALCRPPSALSRKGGPARAGRAVRGVPGVGPWGQPPAWAWPAAGPGVAGRVRPGVRGERLCGGTEAATRRDRVSDTLDTRSNARSDRHTTLQCGCISAMSASRGGDASDATVSDTSSDTTTSASLLISAKWTQLAFYLEKSEA